VASCITAGLTESPIKTWEDTREVMAILDKVRAQIGVVYPNER